MTDVPTLFAFLRELYAQHQGGRMATLESLSTEVAELKAIVLELASLIRNPPSVNPPVVPPEVPVGFVKTPRDRIFPAPAPDKGEMFMGYTMRVGDYLGGDVQRQARNLAGALFITATPLLKKHNGDWVAACEEHLFGDPAHVPDPAWGSYRPGGSV